MRDAARFDQLAAQLDDRTARLAVVGLGFVGTPVACMLAGAGYAVLGLDVVADKVDAINAGRVPFEGEEPGLPELLARVVADERLVASTDPDALRACDAILIAVDTPVDPDSHLPGYAALTGALESIGPRLRPGMLVIVESTLAPGTMGRLVGPTLARASGLRIGRDVLLVHCPERVMPGRLLANLASMSRVVGGTTPEASDVALRLYRHVVTAPEATLDASDALTAELVKTGENAYRDVQIAFANEMALVCEAVGADVWRVRELLNKSPGRAMLLPGAGVGGHCIPKDPWLLISGATGDDVDLPMTARLIPAARAVNDAMPAHMADLAADGLSEVGRTLRRSRVAVLGMSYLADTEDDRNSPSAALVDSLVAHGADVAAHDPWVPAYRDRTVEEVIAGADAVIVMVAHTAYRGLDWAALAPLARTLVLVDGRRSVDAAAARAAGWTVRVVGVGGEAVGSAG
ncbi:MAG: nucleotide sugar dehydrogenase [Ardenticatenales bacterium]